MSNCQLYLISPPTAEFVDPRHSPARLRWLDRTGVTLGAFSGGIFPLARSGLMEGRPCSVHWCYEAAFKAEFPDVKASEAVILRDKRRITASGAGAVFDLMLRLIEEGIAINPHYRKITPMVADELAKWGDWKNAVWIWESVLGSRPYVAAIMTNVARGYAQMGQPDQAMAMLERAKVLQPKALSVRSLEVILLSRNGNEPQALAIALLLAEHTQHTWHAGQGRRFQALTFTALQQCQVAEQLFVADRVITIDQTLHGAANETGRPPYGKSVGSRAVVDAEILHSQFLMSAGVHAEQHARRMRRFGEQAVHRVAERQLQPERHTTRPAAHATR